MGRYIEGGNFYIDGGGFARSICISLCGLRCPSGGVFLHSLDILQRNRIRISSPSISLFGIKIPLLFLPRSYDAMGKSPGFLPPSFSISRRHGYIAGLSFFIPISFFFPNVKADLTISEKYFSKTDIFLSSFEINSKLISSFFSLGYPHSDIFSASTRVNFSSRKYFISLNSDVFSSRFIFEIPADVRKASVPFSFLVEEGRYSSDLGRAEIKFNQSIYLYLEHITKNSSKVLFSEFELSLSNLGGVEGISSGEFSPGFFLSSMNKQILFPFLKGFLSFDDISLLGRIYLSPSFGSPFPFPFTTYSNFIPSDVPLFLYREFMVSPSFFSLSYSSREPLFSFPLFPFSSLSFSGSFFEEIGPFFIPDFGARLFLPRTFFDFSFGFITHVKDLRSKVFSFFNPSLNLASFGGDGFLSEAHLSADFSVYTAGDLYLSSFSLLLSSKHISLKPSFSTTNSGKTFSFAYNPNPSKNESFLTFDLSFLPSQDLSFAFSLISYSFFHPVQVGFGLNHRIRSFCAVFSLDGVYNFVKAEPRISFSFDIRL